MNSVLTHDDIPLFDVVYAGDESGFRQFFRKLPMELERYHELCDTLDFLKVNVLGKRSVRDVV